MHNYEVRRALAKNPDTPLDVAGRIVVSLPKADLLEIRMDDKLHASLRTLAGQRLERLRGAEESLQIADDVDNVSLFDSE
jgi:hypothetical protein